MSRVSSKGQMLLKVREHLSRFVVPDLMVFDAQHLSSNIETLQQITDRFSKQRLVVRSSASDEDGLNCAMAGEYESALNVAADDHQALKSAIDVVLASYTKNGGGLEGHEVIIQHMIQNVTMSGVIFTHDLNTGAPYYVVNYDDVSGQTNTVTSGGGEYANRTLYIHRGALAALRSDRFQCLMSAVTELEQVMGSEFLDIEFALDENLTPFLLQVRAITTTPNWNRGVAKRVDHALQGIQTFVAERFRPAPGVLGKTTVLGQMPDWNPAEMIGRSPRVLAFSLYKTLITDRAWRLGRELMGYRVPAGQPLMVSLAGQPFIDTRLSFHSLIPASLPEEIAEKLVNAWVEKLTDSPELHDKIEFSVAITAYSFDLDDRLAVLREELLSDEECLVFRESVLTQFKKLLDPTSEGSIESAMIRIQHLEERESASGTYGHSLSALQGMLEECIEFGTVPFSILARHGFIAKGLLNSLCARGVFSAKEILAIQSSIRTVASDLVQDMHALQRGEIGREGFMARYGHLRPGTYDILSHRYDQMPAFGESSERPYQESLLTHVELTSFQREKLENFLRQEDWGHWGVDQCMAYIHAAIAGREYGKFVFTRTVSEILELIAEFGKHHGLSREEMSHVGLHHLLEAYVQSGDVSVEEHFREIAKASAEKHALSVAIRLPQVLFDESGVHVVPFQVSHPNFITDSQAVAPVVELRSEWQVKTIKGKIVLIENADPGFDWIFSQEIAGLVTKYGGANSHMAIRCAEFGIPAAIGCGEQRFEILLKSSKLSIDCAAGLINPWH